MSEKIQINAENNVNDEPNETLHRKSHEGPKEKTEHHQARHEHKDKIDEIISKIEKTSKSSEELSNLDSQPKKNKDEYQNVQIGSQLHGHGLKQSLQRIQKELPRREKVFSKFIHNSKVEKISEATGATVARPSGLLAAGFFSFVASLGVLTICRYFGYEYNYLIGLVSLGAGFLVGISLEGFFKIFKRS